MDIYEIIIQYKIVFRRHMYGFCNFCCMQKQILNFYYKPKLRGVRFGEYRDCILMPQDNSFVVNYFFMVKWNTLVTSFDLSHLKISNNQFPSETAFETFYSVWLFVVV